MLIKRNAHQTRANPFFTTGAKRLLVKSTDLGPFLLALLVAPTVYRGMKDMYWTSAMYRLNQQETIADRYEWLRQEMLRDSVAQSTLDNPPASGVDKVLVGPLTA